MASVPTLSVPDAFKPQVSRLAELPDPEFETLKQAIVNLKPHLKPDALMRLAKDAKGTVPDLAEILQTAINISVGYHRSGIPLDEFISGISRSIKLDASKAGLFEKRFGELLNIASLAMSAKAFDIQHRFEKVFQSARVVTDVRPVFNAAGSEVTGAMIVHNLAIGFMENGDFKEVFFAMDDADVATLKKVIERAEGKSVALEGMIQKTGVEYLESR